ncbi:MAG TPA: DJ-1/PfpI family protein [Clostridia bacterium]|nr:DJ-1/PfpI family protein [Clostridia bacterium]
MEEKKIAVMIYPHFSMQEIACLTAALSVWHARTIDVFASSSDVVTTEDGFQVVPGKTFEEFNVQEYCCLMLPGILNPLPALFDERNIAFLRNLAGQNIVIAAISSAPLLLAKAGLLDHKEFTSGVWEEIAEHFSFFPRRNFRHRPLVHDGNIITAIGFAFREFAEETLRAIGIDCAGGVFAGIDREYSEEELTFRMGKEDFAEFLDEYQKYAP